MLKLGRRNAGKSKFKMCVDWGEKACAEAVSAN